jgi:hypothetical protein
MLGAAMSRTLLSFFLVSLSAFAADVAGNWKATAEGPNGTMTRTFTFKVDGAKLSGETVSSMLGKSTIEDGKVDGDTVSFVINVKFQDNEMKVSYKGKLAGDQLNLTAETPQGEIAWVAKRGS